VPPFQARIIIKYPERLVEPRQDNAYYCIVGVRPSCSVITESRSEEGKTTILHSLSGLRFRRVENENRSSSLVAKQSGERAAARAQTTSIIGIDPTFSTTNDDVLMHAAVKEGEKGPAGWCESLRP
jgi:hypothetical protein